MGIHIAGVRIEWIYVLRCSHRNVKGTHGEGVGEVWGEDETAQWEIIYGERPYY